MVRGSRSVGILVDDELFRKFVRVRNRVSLQVTKLASEENHLSARSNLLEAVEVDKNLTKVESRTPFSRVEH